jgi:hypothetical protein
MTIETIMRVDEVKVVITRTTPPLRIDASGTVLSPIKATYTAEDVPSDLKVVKRIPRREVFLQA